MARSLKRRAMIFIDGSALRDTLKKEYYQQLRAGFETTIDYHRLGLLLCSDQREFIRTNFYASLPAYYREINGKKMIGEIELAAHEAHSMDRVSYRFQDLKRHIETGCKFTRLVTGRLLARRVGSPVGPAVKWAFSALEGAAGKEGLTPEDRELLDSCYQLCQDAQEARHRLFRRLEQLCERRQIPRELMGFYSQRMSDLAGESLEFREKGVDTLLAVEMLEMCLNDAFDDAFLFAADEDYVPLVEATKRSGRHVIQTFVEIPRNPNYGFVLRQACDDHRVLTLAEIQGLASDSG